MQETPEFNINKWRVMRTPPSYVWAASHVSFPHNGGRRCIPDRCSCRHVPVSSPKHFWAIFGSPKVCTARYCRQAHWAGNYPSRNVWTTHRTSSNHGADHPSARPLRSVPRIKKSIQRKKGLHNGIPLNPSFVIRLGPWNKIFMLLNSLNNNGVT